MLIFVLYNTQTIQSKTIVLQILIDLINQEINIPVKLLYD